MAISDPRHTKCSNLTEARWAKHICSCENNVPSRLSPQWLYALGHMMYGYALLVPMNQTITLLALLVENSLVHCYQQCVTVNHVPKCKCPSAQASSLFVKGS